MKTATYNYSCLMINAPDSISRRMLGWGKKFIPDDILMINDDAAGRETEFHVTVKYGLLETAISNTLFSILENYKSFPIRVGPVSLFKNGSTKGFDVVKCSVESPELRELNRLVCENCPHFDTYKQYNPHLTIAYVKPDTCDFLIGQNPLGQLNEFVAESVVFASSGDSTDGKRLKERVSLNEMSYRSFFKH